MTIKENIMYIESLSIDTDVFLNVFESNIERDMNLIDYNIMESVISDPMGYNSHFMEGENESLGNKVKNGIKGIIEKIKTFIQNCIESLKNLFTKGEAKTKIDKVNKAIQEQPALRNTKIPIITRIFDKEQTERLKKLDNIQKKIISGNQISEEDMSYINNFDNISDDTTAKQKAKKVGITATATAITAVAAIGLLHDLVGKQNRQKVLMAQVEKDEAELSRIGRGSSDWQKAKDKIISDHEEISNNSIKQQAFSKCIISKAKCIKNTTEGIAKTIQSILRGISGKPEPNPYKDASDSDVYMKSMSAEDKSAYRDFIRAVYGNEAIKTSERIEKNETTVKQKGAPTPGEWMNPNGRYQKNPNIKHFKYTDEMKAKHKELADKAIKDEEDKSFFKRMNDNLQRTKAAKERSANRR